MRQDNIRKGRIVCPHRFRRVSAGFSLIFVSIMLTISAMIFVSLLPGKEAWDNNVKMINNVKKLERVEEAMRSFMAANGRRPCPADGQYAENTAHFGREAANPGTCTGGIPTAQGPDTSTTTCTNGTTGLIDGVHGFQITDSTAGEGFGGGSNGWGLSNVVVADINNDGYKDIIIPANTATVNGVVNAGKTYVVYSSATGLPEPTVTTVSGSNSATVNSASGLVVGQTITSSTIPVSSAITISSISGTTLTLSGHTGVTTGSSTLYIVKTPTAGFIDGTHGFELDGVVGSGVCCGLGSALAAGDFNGDGYQDIITTLPETTVYGATAAGAAYVIFGKAIPQLPATTIITTSASNSATVSSYANLMVGQTIVSANTATGMTISGCGSAVWGTACTQTSITLSANATTGDGVTPVAMNIASTPITALIDGTHGFVMYGYKLGYYVSTGDVNSDGKADILLPDNVGTQLRVVYGISALPSTTVSTTSGSPTATVASNANLAVGQVLYSANIPVGTTITACGGGTLCTSTTLTLSANATLTASGTALNVAGQPLNSTWINGTNGFQITGCCYKIFFSLPLVADFNKDGYPDIVTGSRFNSNAAGNNNAGAIYILFRPSGGWPANTTFNSSYVDGIRAVEFDGPTVNNSAGWSIAAGDFNKDGYSDILIGTPYYAANGVTNAGSVWGIWGQKATVWKNNPVTNLSTVH